MQIQPNGENDYIFNINVNFVNGTRMRFFCIR